jgi:hypothetical protein
LEKLFKSKMTVIFSGEAQKEDAIETLTHVTDSRALAEKAVKDGDDTLKKANNTHYLLQSFQSQVQKSSESAKIALDDVEKIKDQMHNTEDLIQKTEEVRGRVFANGCEESKLILFSSSWKSLTTMRRRRR